MPIATKSDIIDLSSENKTQELNKNNLMANFYKYIRKKNNILIESNGQPVGGKWSFDKDNRKKIPKNTKIPLFPKINETKHTKTAPGAGGGRAAPE